MERKIRVAQYGCGRMGKFTTRYAVDGGAEIVAAFDINSAIIGKDVGDYFGIGNIGVKISNVSEADRILSELKPDICIITTTSFMKEIKDIMLICAKNGVNAISSSEESLYPWNSSPLITKEIDESAKKNNCTITGTGANEPQYGGISSLCGGITHKVNKIIARSYYNVDDYGIALANAHGVGLAPEDFETEIAKINNITKVESEVQIEKGEFTPSYVWNINGWICDYLGLKVKDQTQTCRPVFLEKDIYSQTMENIVPRGNAIGMAAIASTITEEGINIQSESIGIVYGQGEEDKVEIIINGETNTECHFQNPDTVGMTCATIVNRIPDVINATAGFVTTSKMPPLNYRVKPLNKYIVD
ncbi:hypothetical protein [Tissierella sp.]|uniref:NAD(P)H-dependent amine dehydrogenase family protein n=1 Tax=Tissierella sp. TaxID=41274 RepID=UPI00302E1C69